MAKKKKRSQIAMSESLDEEIWMGSPPCMALLPGGGNQGYLYPEECESTGHRSTGNQPFAQRTKRHHRPVTGQMGITQEFSSQSITGHRPSSHWSLDRKYQHRGKSIFTGHHSPDKWPPVTGHQTLYQPTFSETHAMGMEFTNNNSKKSFITPGTNFSKMSYPSVVIELSDNS